MKIRYVRQREKHMHKTKKKKIRYEPQREKNMPKSKK